MVKFFKKRKGLKKRNEFLKFQVAQRDKFIDKLWTEKETLKKKVEEQNLDIENLRNALNVLTSNLKKEKRISNPIIQANPRKVHK